MRRGLEHALQRLRERGEIAKLRNKWMPPRGCSFAAQQGLEASDSGTSDGDASDGAAGGGEGGEATSSSAASGSRRQLVALRGDGGGAAVGGYSSKPRPQTMEVIDFFGVFVLCA